ncbi:MAG TPA: hypothetical protein VFF31_25930 [Blastocatellia bacterium]|jgi:hypothetical protein|nr:hypothetical protein [Blastocatellia bacterium]
MKWLSNRIALCAITVFILSSPVVAQDKRLTLEELIAHHLDSIGSAQARSFAKNRVVTGPVKLVSRVGVASNIDGQAAMASSGAKIRYSMRFSSPQYTGEQLAFDGSKILTGFLPSGRRSPLSLYLEQQSLPLRDGLLGGSISTAWVMLRLSQLKPRLDYKGVKKIDGRSLHEVSYRPEKGSTDLKVAFFFDAESFQHVRTEYEFRVPARLGEGPNDSARLAEDYYKLAEDFEDFRAADALMIPRKYRLQLQVQTSSGSNLFDWTVTIEQVLHNQALDEQIFSK